MTVCVMPELWAAVEEELLTNLEEMTLQFRRANGGAYYCTTDLLATTSGMWGIFTRNPQVACDLQSWRFIVPCKLCSDTFPSQHIYYILHDQLCLARHTWCFEEISGLWWLPLLWPPSNSFLTHNGFSTEPLRAILTCHWRLCLANSLIPVDIYLTLRRRKAPQVLQRTLHHVQLCMAVPRFPFSRNLTSTPKEIGVLIT